MAKSFLSRLGFSVSNEKKVSFDSDIGHSIKDALKNVPEDRIRYLAAFGGLLGRVANADGHISPEEDQRIAVILKNFSDLGATEAELVSEIIHQQTKALAGLENHIYMREINELVDRDKKMEILSCLYAVAAADDEISTEENETIRIITKSLGLSHSEYISIRSLYKDKLAVLKDMPKGDTQ